MVTRSLYAIDSLVSERPALLSAVTASLLGPAAAIDTYEHVQFGAADANLTVAVAVAAAAVAVRGMMHGAYLRAPVGMAAAALFSVVAALDVVESHYPDLAPFMNVEASPAIYSLR